MLRLLSTRMASGGGRVAMANFWRVGAVSAGRFARPFSVSRKWRNEASKDGDNKTHLGSFKVDKPMMMIAFTCKKCDTRSSHTMSKQAYTNGTVLIQCPGCKSRHLISDHLKIFSDDRITVQDILNAKGESVSLTTDDLAFEDIPEKLRSAIGHHAHDAPMEDKKKKMDNESVHTLPAAKREH
ncbi:LANO_0E04984g1_1 [Lachancea nothofagi CBS 11611]|uniref:LANO_0E04984g1_1 n=1 Tax=Lachancea nothofagi CBS 11611 TaxID=1266666 RepID=A0A1G4JSL5_9SACH|nr:LANO_0E04984g1_1 [Lachancea nothofagi CBS 11611]